jgi:two-component system chemotaxis response regulator CheB
VTVRVLVVDDSPVTRSLICSVLAADPEIEVVGQSGSGEQALEALPGLRPDLVTLDVEMPGIGGLETLRRIRVLDRYLPVIMFSSLTLGGASATLDALALGADDYVAKPTGAATRADALAAVADQLLPKLRSLGARRAWRALAKDRSAAPAGPPAGTPVPGPRGPVAVLGIGASTGGPEVLTKLVPALPADLPVPVVIVQHMPALFTSLLAQRLDRASTLAVREAVADEELRPGHVYIAPGDRHLTVERVAGRVLARLDDGPRLHHARPAVDRLFRSLPAAYADQVLALVLTGMGNDGLLGCQAVQSAGGRLAVQDEQSAAVWGMPGAVVGAGLPCDTVQLDDIAGYLVRAVRR